MVNFQFYSDDIIMNIGMGVFFILFSFLFFLFITAIIAVFKKRPAYEVPEKLPKISIIIPAFNEEKNIRTCLKSVFNSDYDKKLMEVIVVDDGSRDNTAEIAKKFKNIRLVEGKHKGKSEALNLGVKKAKNELIVAIDADITLQRDTIKNLVAPILQKDVAATNAIAVIGSPKTMIGYFQMVEYALNNVIRVSFSKVFGNTVWFFGFVACYKKSVLKQIGYFKRDTLTEDMDICLEMYRQKYRIVTVREAMISTKECSSVNSLIKQRMRWYYGALQSLVKSRNLLQSQKKSVPVMFLFGNQFWWTFFAFVFFPLTAYQVYYWMPDSIIETALYIFRWFSVIGPFYVLYKIPVWGVNFLNIFGVMSGIITLLMTSVAIVKFNGKVHLKTAFVLFFYFPYTIILDIAIVAGVIKNLFSKKKYFIL
ncbi:MAG: glycosyltransferase family 2 protein [bacterium]|nr:glycosyltransferase family 2 protein [bacterium]